MNSLNTLYISPSIDFVIIVIVSLLVILVNSKYLRNMKEESKNRKPGEAPSSIQDIMITRTKLAMVAAPFYLFLNWFLTQDYFLPAWFLKVLCYDQYMNMFNRFYLASHSLAISSMRYFFIVHNERVLIFGKDLAKKVFYNLSIGAPLVLTILHACTIPVPPKAYNPPQKSCHNFMESTYNLTCGDIEGIKDDCAPILSLVLKYIPSEITQAVGIFVKIIFVILCSNLVEGILYWKTFGFINK